MTQWPSAKSSAWAGPLLGRMRAASSRSATAHQRSAAERESRGDPRASVRVLASASTRATDGVGELFADGALVGPDGAELARGREAVADFYRRIVILYDGSPRTRHVTRNSEIELDEHTGSASARSDYAVYQAVDGPPRVLATGHYADRFRRVGGDWRFAERRFFVEQMGDLSHHLRATERR